MPCTTARSMRFHVYTIVAPRTVRKEGQPIRSLNMSNDEVYDVHNPINHCDTGKEFTITAPDDTAPFWQEFNNYNGDQGINTLSIPGVMLKKVYGFTTRLYGWEIRWAPEQAFIAGSAYDRWYVKRIV